MKYKLLNAATGTYALVCETGDEVMDILQAFANEHGLKASRFTAIGACSEAVLGYFDVTTKDYRRIPVNEQVEVLSLIGDITLYDGKSKVHAHAVLGRGDGTTLGGHLLSAVI